MRYFLLALVFLGSDALAGSTCADGTHSTSTGSGTCSHHGGVAGSTPSAAPPPAPKPVAVQLPRANTGYDSALEGTKLQPNAQFIIRAVHEDDSHFSFREGIIGLRCVATPVAARVEGQWWQGTAMCEGFPLSFSKMAFDFATN